MGRQDYDISVYDEVQFRENETLRAALAALTLPDPESDMNYQLRRFTSGDRGDWLYTPWVRAAVARVGADVVGWSVVYESRRQPKLYVDVFVREDMRCRGIGMSLAVGAHMEAKERVWERYRQPGVAVLIMSDSAVFKRAFAAAELQTVQELPHKLLALKL